MSIVALDLSLTGTGFACMTNGNLDKVLTIRSNPKTAKDDLARLIWIREQIKSYLPKDLELVVIEDFFVPFNKAQIGAAMSLIMLGTAVRLWFYENKIPMRIISPNQVKKFTTGKGVAQKGMMIKEVFKRYGHEAKDDNQADAISLCYLGQAILSKNASFDYQREVIAKIEQDGRLY